MTRVLVSMRPEAAERLLGRAGDDVDAQVEQHQQVAQVAGEEGHLVGARDEHLVGADDRLDQRLDRAAGDLAGGLLHVQVIGRQRRLELVLVEREQRRGCACAPAILGAALGVDPAVFLARGRLQLGEALEAERLREAHDCGAGGVGAARQLLGRLEGGLVEMVDDVLRHVLLRARALVEARLDVLGQALVLARAVGGSRDGGRSGVLVAAARFIGASVRRLRLALLPTARRLTR